jgi:hypothetical protein
MMICDANIDLKLIKTLVFANNRDYCSVETMKMCVSNSKIDIGSSDIDFGRLDIDFGRLDIDFGR